LSAAASAVLLIICLVCVGVVVCAVLGFFGNKARISRNRRLLATA